MLARAETMSDAGCASVRVYFRKYKQTTKETMIKKKKKSNSRWDRGMRKCERNNPVHSKDSEEGSGGGALGVAVEFFLQPIVYLYN